MTGEAGSERVRCERRWKSEQRNGASGLDDPGFELAGDESMADLKFGSSVVRWLISLSTLSNVTVDWCKGGCRKCPHSGARPSCGPVARVWRVRVAAGSWRVDRGRGRALIS